MNDLKHEEREYRTFESYKERFFDTESLQDFSKRNDPKDVGISLAQGLIRSIEGMSDEKDEEAEATTKQVEE